MQNSFPARAIERLRGFYGQQDFQELCNDFDMFVKAPSLPMWRGWLDVFFVYDAKWFDAFFQYHQKTQTSASRAICLLLVYRKVLYVRGDTLERTCAQQEQLIRDMILATHGLLQPLFNDASYNNAAFVIEALLHMVDAKSIDAQWRMHVVPHLAEEWRLIFLWGQIIIVMAHGAARETIEEALSDCEPHERAILEPLANAYLSTDTQLSQGAEVMRFSQDPLCGDIFVIDMAEYYFEQGDEVTALAWIGDKLPELNDILNANEWLDGAREMIESNAPHSELMNTLVAHGVERGLPGALHVQALASSDNGLLLANAEHGHTDSMVALAERLRDSNQDEAAQQWLLRAAAVFNSDALYLLGNTQSGQGLDYLTQAVQRLHGNTLFDVALAVLNGEVQWKHHQVILQTEGADFDPPQAIYLLEKARDAGVGEAATLLFDMLANHVDEATFFAMCFTAGQVDSDYVKKGYAKALELGQAERVLDWAQLMISAFGPSEELLYEFGVSAHRVGRTQEAVKAWTDAANMGHGLSANKLDDFRCGRLPSAIVPNDTGWQRTWRNLANKFRRE